MHHIKKYANRKLYHTNRKQYITLEGIGELIQMGETVQITDNETGEDITSQILSQVVLQSHGRKSLLPTHLLTDLIQAGGDTISGLRRSVMAAFGNETGVDDAIRQRLQALAERGGITGEEHRRLLRLLIHDHYATEEPAGAASAQDLAHLQMQVEALTQAVEHLLAERRQQP